MLALRWAAPDAAPRWAVAGRTRALAVALVPLTAVMLTLGTVVTGTGPHSGDANAPYRYALDPLLVTRAHSLSVWLFLAVLVALAVDLWRQTRRAGRRPRADAARCAAPATCSACRSRRGRSGTCSTSPACPWSSSACTCSAPR